MAKPEPIVYDYPAIARRLNELNSGSKSSFALPNGVEILISTEVAMPIKFKFDSLVGLVLHVAKPPKLVVVHIRQTDAARVKLLELVEVLRRVCPSLITDRHEIVMTVADCERLIRLLHQS